MQFLIILSWIIYLLLTYWQEVFGVFHFVDLFICLKRLHETFIALAAQLQGIHEQIKVFMSTCLPRNHLDAFKLNHTSCLPLKRMQQDAKANRPCLFCAYLVLQKTGVVLSLI